MRRWVSAAPFASISRSQQQRWSGRSVHLFIGAEKTGSLLRSRRDFKAGKPENFIKLAQESSRIQTGSSAPQSESPMVLNL